MYFFKFDDEVHSYQRFVRENLYLMGNLQIISEQVCIGNKDKNFIDMLAIDLDEKRLVVLELKNIKAKYHVIGQPIQYYDLILRAEHEIRDLLMEHQSKINFKIDEINFNPKFILVVPDFDQQLLRNLTFVNDIDISIVQLNYVQKNGFYEVVKSNYQPDISYHKENLVNIKNKPTNNWNFDEYSNVGVNENKIKLANDFIKYLDKLFKIKNKKFDFFFYEKKISLMVDGKIWGHVIINRNVIDNFIEVNLPIKSKKINEIDLIYNYNIINYKILNKRLKIKFSRLPINLLENIIEEI